MVQIHAPLTKILFKERDEVLAEITTYGNPFKVGEEVQLLTTGVKYYIQKIDHSIHAELRHAVAMPNGQGFVSDAVNSHTITLIVRKADV